MEITKIWRNGKGKGSCDYSVENVYGRILIKIYIIKKILSTKYK